MKRFTLFSKFNLLALPMLLLPLCAQAQEIEPRRWSHLPMGANFLGGAYAYTNGNIYLEPDLRIDDASFEMHTMAIKYIRSFELFGKSARIDLTQPYQLGQWSGLLNGVPASIDRAGWADSFVRFAINLYGAPPLSGQEFADYRAKTKSDTVVGVGLVTQLPTGQYFTDKLINLGSNRFTFRPQFGVVHNWDKWSAELTTTASFFTENDEFFKGNVLEQDPLYTADANLIYTFRPGFWLAGSVGYGYGGITSLNGVESDNRVGNLGFGVSVGLPISRSLGVKFGYIGTRTQVKTGMDSDTLTCAFSLMW
jgi:hypothetical protein